jgi:hypothetical protein
MQRLSIQVMHANALPEQHIINRNRMPCRVTLAWRRASVSLQEIEVADAADAAAHKEASEDIRKYRVTRLTPVLIVCELLP